MGKGDFLAYFIVNTTLFPPPLGGGGGRPKGSPEPVEGPEGGGFGRGFTGIPWHPSCGKAPDLGKVDGGIPIPCPSPSNGEG